MCLLFEAKGVAQKHSGTEDGADGVGDPLARDVGGGAVDGLIETGCGLERGRGGERRCARERRGWEESQGTWDDARLVGKSKVVRLREGKTSAVNPLRRQNELA